MTNNNLNSHNFYSWFLSAGGELYNFSSQIVEKTPVKRANLKSKSQEIKDKYNHKFKNYGDK